MKTEKSPKLADRNREENSERERPALALRAVEEEVIQPSEGGHGNGKRCRKGGALTLLTKKKKKV